MNTTRIINKFIAALVIPPICILSSCSQIKNNDENIKASTDFLDIAFGEDFTELNAKLTLITNRTDLIQDTPEGIEFPDYIAEFNKIYPNISVTVEGVSDYDSDMAARLSSGNWGDICCVPAAVSSVDYPKYLEPLGNYDELSEIYEFVDQCLNERIVYGIPTSGNVQGIVYNKRIWKEAGIDKTPATPDEFINSLEAIKNNTEAIPLYTNYAAIWPLGTWDTYIYSCATGNMDYKYNILPYKKNPFSKQPDNSGPYEVFNILYQAASKKLIEDNPAATSWELSKAALNRGEISAMVLGSWAVSQVQAADKFSDDVGYMPFPISVNGTQYSIATGDYAYGINSRISEDKKTAAKIFIKYIVEKSSYAYDQGSIPILKGSEYPAVLKDFENTTLLKDNPPAENSDFHTPVNSDSGIVFGADSTHVSRIIDSAISGEESFEDIINDWNEAWSSAQEKNNITVIY